MKFFPALLAAACLVCFTSSLRAQDDPKRTAAAEELLKAMHAGDLVGLQKEAMKKTLGSRLPKNLPPEVLKQLQDKLDAGLDDILKDYSWDLVRADFVGLYSRAFTESELKELTAFYNSPIGRKFIEKRSEVEGGALEIMQKSIQTCLPEIGQLMKETLEAAKAAQSSSTPGGTAPAPQK